MKIAETKYWDIPDLEGKIREARTKSKKTMTALCSAANITPSYWYQIEAGKVEALPVGTLRSIEMALGVLL